MIVDSLILNIDHPFRMRIAKVALMRGANMYLFLV
jgi:hypothetical protein